MPKRRKKTVPIDPQALQAVPGLDVVVLGLGWLFSLRGFCFLAFCCVGVWTGAHEIHRSLNNHPIEITGGDLRSATSGRNVKIRGIIEAGVQITGQRRYSKEPFTLTVLRDPPHTVVIYTPSLLPDKALMQPVERWFEGELTPLNGIEDRIDGNRIPVRSRFRDFSIELTPGAFVVADSVIPQFHWWYVVIFGLCLFGLVYIGYRVLWTIVFLGNRDALYRYLTRHLQKPRNRPAEEAENDDVAAVEDTDRRS